MQNKGAILFFAIALAIVCLFQLSFTIVTKVYENKAHKNAYSVETENKAEVITQNQLASAMFDTIYDGLSKEEKNAVTGNPSFSVIQKHIYDSLAQSRYNFYLDSMSTVPVYYLGIKHYGLYLRKYNLRECREREVNLGLDLKGGMNVTMEISVGDIIKGLANKNADKSLYMAIDSASVWQKKSNDDFVTLFGKAITQIDKNVNLASNNLFGKGILEDKIRATKDSEGKINNEDILNIIRNESNLSIDRAFLIIRDRIDRFGVTQPNVQKLQNSGRILIELPGVKEPERVRKLLQGTANLEFWGTFRNEDVIGYLEKANQRLSELKNITKDTTSVNETEKEEEKLSEEAERKDFNQKNPLFSLLRPSVFLDNDQTTKLIPGPSIGETSVKDTASIMRMLNDPAIKNIFPKNLKLLWTKPDKDKNVSLIAIKIEDHKKPDVPLLSGNYIKDARQDYNQEGKVEVLMIMDSEGANKWRAITGKIASEKNDNISRSVAIVLDEMVYSYPNVIQEIPNGRSSISGNFSIDEAKDLANILKAGSLPAPAKIVEEVIIGPSLGKEAINSGLISFIVAFLIVLLYMFLFYNKAGIIADIALATNIFFIFGVLASFGAVLTLPGIAGIVLTLGMAVDANVIIYERILEEIRAGKALRLAIDDGYKKAYSAIIDGNVTTLLTAIVLLKFGSGPVQGFATTLIIGILSSLFTAIFFSRIIFLWLLKGQKNISFCNSFTKNFLANTNINFLKPRKKFYIISGTVIIIGIASLFVNKLNFGVDFAGGRSYIIRFDQSVNVPEIRKDLTAELGETPVIKTFGPDNQIKMITKFKIDEKSPQIDSIIERSIYTALTKHYAKEISYEDFTSDNENKILGRLSSQMVGPTVARDIQTSAITSVFIALIIIFIYIAIRFKRWQFGLAGLIALFHDTFIVIAVYSLFSNILPFTLEIDQTFIAAILTIIGYSINDTVIIFDRIRENINTYPKRDIELNMNSALNSTLSRTVNTSGTTLLVLLIIMLFGGEVIRGFSFSLFIGIAIGTYSSVFIASPIALDMIKFKLNRAKNKDK